MDHNVPGQEALFQSRLHCVTTNQSSPLACDLPLMMLKMDFPLTTSGKG
jgi:hypothetical protein